MEVIYIFRVVHRVFDARRRQMGRCILQRVNLKPTSVIRFWDSKWPMPRLSKWIPTLTSSEGQKSHLANMFNFLSTTNHIELTTLSEQF